ncbi:hypothetical protein VZC37_10140 [Gordonia sp. LSe1-13]|uniref:ESX-1 secretion-associated protein n=1 Tax=Gordonia sesuvii TaxID=3116777 RepID=A0ABU7MDI2_9ACTN|nr:hypothetical protein [Gordonia sp. LSe1-13]
MSAGMSTGPTWHPDAGGAELRADLDALSELSDRVGSAHTQIDRIVDDVVAVLAAADSAVGVDDGARAFRAGFASLADETARSVEAAAAEIARHRALIGRGVTEIGEADHDVALTLQDLR